MDCLTRVGPAIIVMYLMTKQIVASVALALGLLGAPGCGSDGLSPREGCEELMVVLCNQIYTCFTAAEIMAEGFPAMEAACVTALQTDAACAAQTNENACEGGEPGETFHAEAAESCVNQIEALSCEQVRNAGTDLAVAAPSCAQVCSVD